MYSYQLSFRPFQLSAGQRFEAILVSLIMTAATLLCLFVYLIAKFHRQLRAALGRSPSQADTLPPPALTPASRSPSPQRNPQLDHLTINRPANHRQMRTHSHLGSPPPPYFSTDHSPPVSGTATVPPVTLTHIGDSLLSIASHSGHRQRPEELRS